MRVEDFESIIRKRLADTNQSPHGAAKTHGLPQDAIRSVLDGHVPRLDRVIDICDALGLEVYIGKSSPRSQTLSLDTLRDDLKRRDQKLLDGIQAILDRVS